MGAKPRRLARKLLTAMAAIDSQQPPASHGPLPRLMQEPRHGLLR
jgi:hypothetical protein